MFTRNVTLMSALALLLPSLAAAQTEPSVEAPLLSETAASETATSETTAPITAEHAAASVVDESGQSTGYDADFSLYSPGGLTADMAAERAVSTAPSMARAEAAVVVAEAGARRAWQSFFPQLTLSARYTRLSNIDAPSFGGATPDPAEAARIQGLLAGVDDPEAQQLIGGILDGLNSQGFEFPVVLDQFALRASMTYPVSDLLFTILPAYEAQQSAVAAQTAQLVVQQRQVAIRARETYYEVARARLARAVADRAVVQIDAHRAQVSALVEGGVLASVELLRINAQAAQARVGVARAHAGEAISEQALRVLLHWPTDRPIEIGDDLSVPPTVVSTSAETLVERALEERAEIHALKQAMEAREQGIRAQLGQRYPHLLLQANLDFANPNQRIFPTQQEFNTTWDVSVILQWSPNEWGAARQQVIEARASVLQMSADIEAIRDGIRIQVYQALASLTASRAVLEASSIALEAAEENHRVRMAQLEAGAAVSADLIDAETDLTRAHLAVVNASVDLHLQHARLQRAAALD